ncbi:MAG: GeoRSP system PqqD family peptide chaperone [Geobacter sp.]|nr:GeoRSP system PqqD family peptide chaperone [Geobacter sp.]
MQGIMRNPVVMWREELDAMTEAQNGLDRGDDVGDIGTAVLFSGGAMLSINFLGTEIWKLCDGRSMDEIVSALLEQFDVERDVLREDVQSFIDELTKKGFVTNAE